MLLVLILNWFTLILSQLAHSDFQSSVLWFWTSPAAFLVSCFLMSMISLLLIQITNSYRTALMVPTLLVGLISLISYLKQRSLGVPLYPWDFYISNEAFSMVPAILSSTISKIMIIVIVLLVAAFFYWIPAPKIKPRGVFLRSVRGFFGSIGIAFILMANNPVHSFLFTKFFKIKTNDARASYSENGILIGFVLLIEQTELYAPANYSVAKAQQLLSTYSESRKPTSTVDSISAPVNPDVIVIMSESLFDPIRLKGLQWKEDPLKFTRSLARGRDLSKSIVPSFGFRTANSEFEFLTGHSLEFFSQGTIPYVKLIHDHQQSIVDSFHRANYKTVAIHPGARTFYDREKVYQDFGFDKYESAEHFDGSGKFGNYYSDRSVLAHLKKSLEESTHPTFHFIVTLQNHYPYLPNPFELKSDLLLGDNMPASEKVILSYYAELVRETDRVHEELVNYLSQRGKPTLLIIYGDHLPGLLPNYGGYIGRMISQSNADLWTREETKRMMTTPLAIWSNFGYPEEEHSININFVGVRMLRNLGLPMTPYQKFVADFSDSYRHLNPKIAKDLNDEKKVRINDYKIFQYATFLHDVEDGFPGLAPINAEATSVNSDLLKTN